METVKLSVYVAQNTYDTIKKLSCKKKCSMAEVLRQYLLKGLDIDSYLEEQDMLRGIIRSELETVLEKQLDRIIRLQLKATKASAISMYAVIRDVAENYADDGTMEIVLANASKAAAKYMKTKEFSTEEYIKASKELLEISKSITKETSDM